MGFSKPGKSMGASLTNKTSNKLKRKELYVLQKKEKDKSQREMRFRRKKEEDKDPELRAARLAKNKPKTLDSKRVWDDVDDDSLGNVFPSLFTEDAPPPPKILITTSLNSTLHYEANIFRTVFPNSTYVPRSAHRYGHKYSLREISKFASNRDYTAVVLLKEDQKKLTGMSIVHLPTGPTFTFSITNFMEGKKLPGHGNPTNHYPELLLNNFKTPLGLLTAALFQRLFPPQPELEGRQVLTVHNQRDYLFFRRHRYVFREKRETEKNITTAEGAEMKGVEGIRVGLQEVGPRFTAKLRRVDKGIGRAGSEGEDSQPWEWKAKMEKDRKRFNL
ncbi:ribosome production factor 1 [Colletotrichum tofieldiae]|nr:ribosome production factor 1 [Colletotrichum tofieldiae]